MKKTQKPERIDPKLPGGFRDYGPREARIKQRILDTARSVFELFGFEPLETPAVELTETVTGGEGDAQKIIYNVTSSRQQEEKSKEKLSLRFDLTVPLARFVAANPDIPKPFKRYQIGNVWRGERQQAGRYREFTQADVDIVGMSSPDADSEIIAIIDATLKNLGIDNFLIKINDRAILNTLSSFAGFPKEKLWDALRIIDKKDKIGRDGVCKELESEFRKEVAKKIGEFVEDEKKDREGSENIKEIMKNLDELGIEKKNWKFDPSLVRGLSYYTGTVFEAILTDAPEIGSVFGGGRYDDLVMRFTGQPIPAVGASLGVDRLLAALEKLGKLATKKTTLGVLILNFTENMKPEYLALARELRAAKINTSLYLGEDKAFQAQLSYAVKKETPYVIMYGEEEKNKNVVAVKNLNTRVQNEVPREKIVEYLKKEVRD